MSNYTLPKALVLVGLLVQCGQTMAGWQTDCAAISGACDAIKMTISDYHLGELQPPAPCINKESLASFTEGQVATCNGSSGSLQSSGSEIKGLGDLTGEGKGQQSQILKDLPW